MNPLEKIDPAWAWRPYEEDSARSWNRRLAIHLFRRAGFGATEEQIARILQQSPQQAVADLLRASPAAEAFHSAAETLTTAVLAGGNAMQLSSAWIYRLLHTPHQLQEKMTLFWHGHFATSADKVDDVRMMWTQNQLIRQHALGRFEPLVQAIARDPAMLIYLDSESNRKAHPNENFARELMELFCLGEGHYTEADVQELARCFTGWEIKNGSFRKNRYQQDRDRKTVLGTTGEFDGEDAVRIVLGQPETGRFIARKLFRYFVCDQPAPPDQLIEPLAELFRARELEVAPLVETILSSNLFFSEHAVARKIRSPVELAIGFLRCVEGTTNTILLAEDLKQLGQGLFYPPNVKGWDGGRAWINSSTLLGRSNLIHRMLADKSTRCGGQSLPAHLASRGARSAPEIVAWFSDTLLAIPLANASREQVLRRFERSGELPEQAVNELVHVLTTIPEFHLA